MKKDIYKQVGWWIPGSLKSGWNADVQANYNDMANKFNQLGITPLVSGIMPNVDLGLYYSMAEFDYIQLLTVHPPEGTQITEAPLKGLAAYSIVAYSAWMASQGWSSFSPIPITQLQGSEIQGIENELLASPNEGYSDIAITNQTYFPVGWYFVGSFSSTWYKDIYSNYTTALLKRVELGIQSLSPLYFCQSAYYDCVQMVQAPLDSNSNPKVGAIQEYVSWFNEMGFGSLKSIPFMSEDLLNEAVQISSKTP